MTGRMISRAAIHGFYILSILCVAELRRPKDTPLLEPPPPPPSPNDQKIPSCFRMESYGGLSPELQNINSVELCRFQAIPGRLYELHLWKVTGIGSLQLSNAIGDVVDYITFDGGTAVAGDDDDGHAGVSVTVNVDCFEGGRTEGGGRMPPFVVRFSCESLACAYLDHSFTESKEKNCEQQREYIILAIASGLVLLALSVGTYYFVQGRRGPVVDVVRLRTPAPAATTAASSSSIPMARGVSKGESTYVKVSQQEDQEEDLSPLIAAAKSSLSSTNFTASSISVSAETQVWSVTSGNNTKVAMNQQENISRVGNDISAVPVAPNPAGVFLTGQPPSAVSPWTPTANAVAIGAEGDAGISGAAAMINSGSNSSNSSSDNGGGNISNSGRVAYYYPPQGTTICTSTTTSTGASTADIIYNNNP